MKYSNLNRYLYIFKTVLAGLFATQIIGTVHVYLSNSALHQSMQLVQEAGYLAVPNQHVWGALQGIGTAFRGGLFFTLSIGTGLSVAALFCAWTWDRMFGRRKAALYIYLALWILAIGAINANGFSPMSTAYMALVPPLVFCAALFRLPSKHGKVDRFHKIAYPVVPVLLILVFLPLAKKSIFLDIRDTVLLSNTIGRMVNTYYYEYTLYAAQAFKALEQKTIKTFRLDLDENESHRPAIENIFLAHDYLVIDGDGSVDLSVEEQEGKLLFNFGDKTIFTSTLREFGADSSSVLQQFSQKTDRFGPLRLVAFVSMAVGAPLCLYIILHGIFFLLLVRFLGRRRAGFTALLLCLLAGMVIALPLYAYEKPRVDVNNLSAALESARWQERVAALHYMELNGLQTDQIIEDTQGRLNSPHIAERYSYVLVLGTSKGPEAGKALLAALDDPSINVRCMAFFSLGSRGDTAVIEEILKRVKKSDKWYEQRYGYRALRALGWKQTRAGL